MARPKKEVHEAEVVSENKSKKLYRSQQDKMIGGVCGGLGEYFNIDSLWVRLVMILLVFAEGVGLFIYIILWILVPYNPNHKEKSKTYVEEKVETVKENVKKEVKKEKKEESKAHIYFGIIFVVFGLALFLDNFIHNFFGKFFWPILIISVGLIMLMNKK